MCIENPIKHKARRPITIWRVHALFGDNLIEVSPIFHYPVKLLSGIPADPAYLSKPALPHNRAYHGFPKRKYAITYLHKFLARSSCIYSEEPAEVTKTFVASYNEFRNCEVFYFIRKMVIPRGSTYWTGHLNIVNEDYIPALSTQRIAFIP